MMATEQDFTLEEIRQALAPAIAANAAFDGWSDPALMMAAEAHGIDADVARLAFAGGAVAMLASASAGSGRIVARTRAMTMK